jgi:hypothetical protein
MTPLLATAIAGAAALTISLATTAPGYSILAWSATVPILGLWLAHVWMFTLRSARETARLSDPATGDSEEFWTRNGVSNGVSNGVRLALL